MARGTESGGDPTVLRMILGKQLEELRLRAGMTFAEAAEAIDVSHSTIRRMESAKVARLRPPDVEMLLRSYGVTGQDEIDAFLRTVREANQRGWWRDFRDVVPEWLAAYLSLEQAAQHIRCYEAQFVHELLQTPEYTRAMALATTIDPRATSETVERRVALAQQRQQLLLRPDAPRLWVVLDEAVLRRPFGGRAVMRAQLDRVCEMAALPNVTVQIMPFAHGPHPAMWAGAFHLLRFEAPELPDIVYLSALLDAVHVDKRNEVMAYREALDRLSAQAAPANRTAELVTATRQEF